jgi:hypothetical protein
MIRGLPGVICVTNYCFIFRSSRLKKSFASYTAKINVGTCKLMSVRSMRLIIRTLAAVNNFVGHVPGFPWKFVDLLLP